DYETRFNGTLSARPSCRVTTTLSPGLKHSQMQRLCICTLSSLTAPTAGRMGGSCTTTELKSLSTTCSFSPATPKRHRSKPSEAISWPLILPRHAKGVGREPTHTLLRSAFRC